MAIIAFELKDFKALGIPQEKIEETILNIGVEIEEKSASEIKMNVTPNRPDLLDFVGLTRAIENFAGKSVPQQSLYKVSNEPVLTIEVAKEVGRVRPYIAGLVVKSVDLSGNRLKYLMNFVEKFTDTYGRKRKKLAVGVHNLDVIKGSVTYTASHEESFVPLGSSKEMSFSNIMREHEKGLAFQPAVPNYGAKGVLYPYIKDAEKVLALIPVINSEATKVTNSTKELFVDITGTSLTTVRNAAALLACSFIAAGAEIYPVTVAYPKGAEVTPDLSYREIKVSMKKADLTLGIETGKHNIIALANRMGYVAAKYGNNVLFYVPPYRIDVLSDQDIIEDIAIAYGYDKIVPLPISGFSEGLPNDLMEDENNLAVLMTGLGYSEAINTMLTNEQVNFENVLMKYNEDEFVRIADSKTSTITMLRTAILPGLLQNLGSSSKERMPQRLFEIGRVFTMENDMLKESIKLAFVSEHARANFSEARSLVDAVLKSMGADYRVEPCEERTFIPGRCAHIKVKNEIIGRFGEIHPKVLLNFGLEEPVIAGYITIIKEVKYEA